MPPELDTPGLVDGSGRPLTRTPKTGTHCPRCGGTTRVASSGFGLPHPVCGTCGYEWPGVPFIAEER